MARPRKPTAYLRLAGSFDAHPERRRPDEPQCDNPPQPHDTLSENGRRAWDFLCETAVEGVLTRMDSSYLALVAEALSEIWYSDEPPTIETLYKTGNMLGRLGMTPSDRSRIVVPRKRKDRGNHPYGEL
jgi:hypothetical protein